MRSQGVFGSVGRQRRCWYLTYKMVAFAFVTFHWRMLCQVHQLSYFNLLTIKKIIFPLLEIGLLTISVIPRIRSVSQVDLCHNLSKIPTHFLANVIAVLTTWMDEVDLPLGACKETVRFMSDVFNWSANRQGISFCWSVQWISILSALSAKW